MYTVCSECTGGAVEWEASGDFDATFTHHLCTVHVGLNGVDSVYKSNKSKHDFGEADSRDQILGAELVLDATAETERHRLKSRNPKNAPFQPFAHSTPDSKNCQPSENSKGKCKIDDLLVTNNGANRGPHPQFVLRSPSVA